MATVLSSEIEEMIEARLATGLYRSVEDVIKKALDALDSAETIAAVIEANAQYEAGQFEPWEQSDAEFRKQHGIAERK